MVDEALTDESCQLTELLGQRMGIDGSPHHLCSSDEVEALVEGAFDRSWGDNPPELVTCCLPPHYHKEWT